MFLSDNPDEILNVKNGETKTIPARYTFVYVKTDRSWLIVDHHSSTMPAASHYLAA